MQENIYDIYAKPEKNRIYMKLKGFFRDEQVKEASDKFLSELEKLQPNFDIINDISEFRPATAKGAQIIKDAQIKVAQKGIKRLVRIVDKSVSGLLQFKTTAKEAGYDGIAVSSLEEAIKYLESN
ncbi:MAG: hypothetical protein OEV78_06075 [Spirochaetia bacterium]|nr:hypothetical protein [Spirochaetia bacterium]